jgi:signal transduction histidine kinase
VRIEITNSVPMNGSGRPAAPGTGMGLVGLAERVGLAGGQLDHERTAKGEFHLRAWLPWTM